MALNLANLVVNITGNANPLYQVLGRVHRDLTGFSPLAGVAFGGLLGAGGAALALGGSLAYAAKQAMNLEHAYGQIRKTTGLVGAEFEDLKKRIQTLSTTIAGVSLEELLGIAEQAGRQGVQGAEGIAEFTKAIAMIRIAMDDIPAEEAATHIARILNVFHYGTDAALSFASALNKLDDSSTATGRELLTLTEYMSGTASVLKMTPQQVLALAATLKDAGVSTEVAGTAMSNILMGMAKDVGKFAKLAGVSINDFKETIKSDPLKAIKMIVAAIAKLDQLEQIKALDYLGLDARRTGGSFMQLASVIDKLDEKVAQANSEWKTHASILREVEIRSQEAGAQWQRAGNNMKLLAEGIGAFMLPVIKAFADEMGVMATAVRNGVDDAKGSVNPWVDWLVQRIGDVGLIMRNLPDIFEIAGIDIADTFNYLTAIVNKFLTFFATNWKTLLIDAFSMVTTALMNLQKNFMDFSVAVGRWLASGGQKPFEFKLTPVLEGFEWKTPPGGGLPEHDPSFEAQRQAARDRMADRERRFLDDKAKAGAEAGKIGEKKPQQEGTGQAPPTKQATFSDPAAFAKRIQEGIFGKDIPKQQLAVQKQQLAVAQKQLAVAQRGKEANPAVALGPG